jgi:hypothetical protein
LFERLHIANVEFDDPFFQGDGNFAFVLSNPRSLSEPIWMKGKLGIWYVDESERERILACLPLTSATAGDSARSVPARRSGSAPAKPASDSTSDLADDLDGSKGADLEITVIGHAFTVNVVENSLVRRQLEIRVGDN